MFYALTQNEKLIMDKVNLFIALAPIVRPQNSTFPNILKAATYLPEFEGFLNLVNIYEVWGPLMKQTMVKFLASDYGQYEGYFESLMNVIKGEKSDLERSYVSAARFPQETSTKSLIHLGQLFLGTF